MTMIYSKSHPFPSRIIERYSLTKPGSSKKTIHIALDIAGVSFPYKVGDSIGVLPQNNPEEVAEIEQRIGAKDPQLSDFLLNKANLSRVTLSFLKTFAPHLIQENVNEFLHAHHLIDILRLDPEISLHPSDLMRSLLPLMPRFYSIANSSKMFPNEIHLTVANVEYMAHGRLRRGIGSHFLCNMADLHTTSIPIYVQPSHGFALPEDPNASLIFVGPGTGVAPFRAFLQERLATQAPGRSWLFFGERNRKTDFLYEPFWLEMEKQERLRLDLAFSRDGSEKIYVQNRMYEQRKSLWDWMQNGAYFYVCGDAKNMAKDVEAMLRTIAQEEGSMTHEEARQWLKNLRLSKRYLADVY